MRTWAAAGVAVIGLAVIGPAPVMAGSGKAAVTPECVQAARPHVEQARMINRGNPGQTVDLGIHFNEWPTACAVFRRIGQYRLLMGTGQADGGLQQLTYWGEGGAYASNQAGSMGGAISRPPNSPNTAYRCTPGRKVTPVLLEMRARIQRLGTKQTIKQHIYWHHIEVDGGGC